MDLTSPIVIGFLASFFLLGILALTSFVKISVVFMIIRNAMGLQQIPSNAVLMALALFISLFISLPVITEATNAIKQADITPETPADFIALWGIGIAPFQDFIVKNIDPDQLDFFVGVSNEVWKGSGLVGTKDDFIIQLPSFMLTELTEAFEIGFLLYLPFVAIDLAVTGILMAMGMQMVQPNIISVPFKLLIFVLVNGWAKLVQGLILTYGG
ncbi:EscR/YscR/HrcR family type III secretion system export apparatus protein [Amylibacter sp. SFDW26]|uniref:type III secretion system export apparatus subunit SctR n=1 Tax=Amylibacter sp. SFDW26 TaxID=2652722 RepID=UPI0012614D1C|nr:type III secretion system export apparatus subunit SctR [Amylibacter sp. SFDW26]KAB7613603.1 EscR/YscR/HrcR family type III secretion system export apparatus protein [Amylibacter sp. SFDW26]